MGKHSLSRYWAKHDLGFKINLGVKSDNRSAFQEIMDDVVEHPRITINRYADSEIPLTSMELAELWNNSLLYHYQWCRCEMCTLRKMLEDSKGVEHDQLWINGRIYPVENGTVDFSEHHEDCACEEHNERCNCESDCPCFRYGLHDYHGRFDCRVAPTFKYTPAQHVPCKSVVEDNIAAQWDSANLL